ncbi:hypothetical protein [Roseococcus sp. YIM B11640]|uniref:hypothetical protein n=1 Tax=Roseococcus sp. YIM B11640 TaxID=3133973 RepID=UPI003C799562
MTRVLPRVSNRDFERQLQAGRFPHSPCRVIGDVKLEGAEIPNTIRLTDTVFTGHVSLAGCRIAGSLMVWRCRFESGLDLCRSSLDGNLSFLEVTGTDISARDASIGKDVYFTAVSLQQQPGVSGRDIALDLTGLSAGNIRIGPPDHNQVMVSFKPGEHPRLVVNGPVGLSSVKCRDLALDKIKAKAIALRDAEIGRVIVQDVQVEAGFDAVGARGRSMAVEKLASQQIDLRGTQLVNLVLSEITCRQQLMMSKAAFYDCSLTSVSAGETTLDGVKGALLRAEGLLVQSLYIADADVPGMMFRGLHVEGNFWGGGLRCNLLQFQGTQGTLWSDSGKTPEKPSEIDGNYIKGSLDLWSATVTTQLHFEAIDVASRIWLSLSTFGGLRFAGIPPKTNPVFAQAASPTPDTVPKGLQHLRAGALILQGVTVAGDCDILELEVGGRNTSTFDGALMLHGCDIKGVLAFWRASRVDSETNQLVKVGERFPDARCRVLGELQVMNCKVARDVDLTNVEVERTGATARYKQIRDGGIVLLGTTIAGELKFSVIRDLPRARALADLLDMKGLEARDVDLTGLDLREPIGEESEKGVGHVMAEGVQISHDLRLHRGQHLFAGIPGALHLDGARIGHLIVTADGFSRSASKDAQVDGIVLREAKIEHLEMPFQGHCTDDCNGFPVPLDLTGADIRNWSFPNRDTAGNKLNEYEIASNFLNALDNDVTFSRGIYRSIAKKLREEGRMDAALRIHFTEHYRAFWEHRRGGWTPGSGRMRPPRRSFNPAELMSRGGDWLYRKLLRYGASPLPLVFVIIGLMATSLFVVAAESRNFELTGANRQLIAVQDVRDARINNGGEGRTARDTRFADLASDTRPCLNGKVIGPRPEDWTGFDAVWMTLRYHVPVLSIVARDDVVPTDDRGLIPAIRVIADAVGVRAPNADAQARNFWTWEADGHNNAKCETPGPAAMSAPAPDDGKSLINPEDWFQTMAILNWIMWPLLITGLLQRLVIQQR